MNKNDIYKLIGYHGEYNANVKRELRKLLKENHPDNKGNRKKFELINEVKKELESGKVLYQGGNILKNNNDVDINYCYRRINELKLKKSNLDELLNVKKEFLNNYEMEYKDLYQESLDLENHLLVNSPYIKRAKGIKVSSIILIILMIIVFSISIIENNNLFFITFIVLSIICIFVIQKYLFLIHKMTENNKKRLANYFKVNNNIRKNVKKQNSLKKEIRDIKIKTTNIENDLRFYKNLLK